MTFNYDLMVEIILERKEVQQKSFHILEFSFLETVTKAVAEFD